MWTHSTLSRQKVTPRVFGVVRTSKGNRRKREKEKMCRRVEVGRASVVLSVTLQKKKKNGGMENGCVSWPPGFIGADNREGAGDVALATY